VKAAAGHRAREACALAVVAAAIAAALLYLGPPGTDFAEHAYQEGFYAQHGFALWNNLWYSGRYSFVTYSVLYYPLAAVAGIRALAAACSAVAVLAFSLVTVPRWGPAARWSNLSMTVVLPGFVLTGAFPFLLGATLSLLALVALERRRWPAFAALAALSAAASPLAFLLLGVVVGGFALGDRWRGVVLVRGVSILSAIAAAVFVTTRLFGSGSWDPFPVPAFLPAIACSIGLAALTWRVEAARPLRFAALFNAAACSGAFLVSSDLGEGVTRLRYVALPIVLLALPLRRWRPRRLALVAVLAAAYWNGAPLVRSFAVGVDDPTVDESYWQPATAFLHAHLSPSFRVEVVDTTHHWAAAYLPAAGIPLVRGWFRQDDFPQNLPLYGELTPATYLGWLHRLGVGFVVLSDAPPDYSAVQEAALLRGGRSGLPAVFRSAHLTIFRVPSPRPIISGPGAPRLVALDRNGMTARVAAAGSYRIAVRSSPYWHTSVGCLQDGGDGMLRLRVPGPGAVRITFRVSVPAMLDVISSGRANACAGTARG
jgi:hypothetical protein